MEKVEQEIKKFELYVQALKKEQKESLRFYTSAE